MSTLGVCSLGLVWGCTYWLCYWTAPTEKKKIPGDYLAEIGRYGTKNET